jgi:hypothetical protein
MSVSTRDEIDMILMDFLSHSLWSSTTATVRIKFHKQVPVESLRLTATTLAIAKGLKIILIIFY